MKTPLHNLFRDTKQQGKCSKAFIGIPSKSLSESPMAVIETILLTPLPEHFKLNL